MIPPTAPTAAPPEPQKPKRHRRLRSGLSGPAKIALAVVAAAVLYLVSAQIDTQITATQVSGERDDAQDERDDAQQVAADAKEVTDPLAELCRRDPEVRKRVGVLCDKAVEVSRQPTPPAADHDAARDGRDGRGIAATAIRGGRLLVSYTDGQVEDKGRVVGVAGKHGADGRAITGTAIADGALVLSFSDGTTETVGQVVGADGVDGRDGRDGRAIASVAISSDYRLIVTYTDGETVDVGPLPAGRGIASVAFDLDKCEATVTYTDGAVDRSPMAGCPPGSPEPEPEPEQEPSLRLPIPGG